MVARRKMTEQCMLLRRIRGGDYGVRIQQHGPGQALRVFTDRRWYPVDNRASAALAAAISDGLAHVDDDMRLVLTTKGLAALADQAGPS